MIKRTVYFALLITFSFFYAGCAARGKGLIRLKAAPVTEGTPVIKVVTFEELNVSPTPGPTLTTTPQVPDTKTVSYRIKKGDSLSKIARTVTGKSSNAARIASDNHLENSDDLEVGQVLVITLTKENTKQEPLKIKKKKTATPTPVIIKKVNKAFSPGEKLAFSVQWMNISGGTATMEDKELVNLDGRLCHHIVCQAISSPFFSSFFKVKDQVDSYIDAAGLFPWRYEKRLHEGGFSADTFINYDQSRHIAFENNKPPVDIPAETQDVVSCFYYCRTLPLEVGKDVFIKTNADGKNWELQVKVLKKEKIKLPSGDYDCIVVQPLLKFNGVFQQKGDIFIWMTDDDKHIPVLVKSKVVIGTIDIVLQDAVVVE